jgi:hypothetical protein
MEDYNRKRSEAESALGNFEQKKKEKEQKRIEEGNSMFKGIIAVSE